MPFQKMVLKHVAAPAQAAPHAAHASAHAASHVAHATSHVAHAAAHVAQPLLGKYIGNEGTRLYNTHLRVRVSWLSANGILVHLAGCIQMQPAIVVVLRRARTAPY